MLCRAYGLLESRYMFTDTEIDQAIESLRERKNDRARFLLAQIVMTESTYRMKQRGNIEFLTAIADDLENIDRVLKTVERLREYRLSVD